MKPTPKYTLGDEVLFCIKNKPMIDTIWSVYSYIEWEPFRYTILAHETHSFYANIDECCIVKSVSSVPNKEKEL